MHPVRTLSFATLVISVLRGGYMYIQRRRDVHAGKTPSIPVAAGPIPVQRKPLSIPFKSFSAEAKLRDGVKLT